MSRSMPAPASPLAPSGAPACARRAPVLVAALIVLVVGGGAIAGAWIFELVVGLVPCPLCLTQRVPYYVGLPIAALVALGAWRGGGRRGLTRGVLRAALGLVALAMLTTAGIAAYHAGVEWHWWAGPSECSGTPMGEITTTTDLLAQMKSVRLVRCDEPAWEVLGLSLAGWNAVISTALALVAAWGAVAEPPAA